LLNITMPKLYQKQYDAFFNEAKISITEGSTKSGKTLSAIVWQATKVLEDKLGLPHHWIAPVYSQSKMAFDQAKVMFREVYVKANESDLSLHFPNASIWVFKSGEKSDNLYGSGVGSLVIDEYTRLREESYYAAMSTTVATEAQVRLIGNVRGRGWGWKLARLAQSGAVGYSYHKITILDALKAGVVSLESYEKSKRDYPEDVFRELFLCIPRDDAGNPFGAKHIQDCIVPSLSQKQTVCFGVDLAKSVDYTVVIGLDEDGTVTQFHRWQGDWNKTRTTILNIIGNVPALVDSTGVGNPIVEDLQRYSEGVEAFNFSSSSKQRLMEGLVSGIQTHTIHYPAGLISEELDNFEYVVTQTGVRYAAASGHDDCVMALALAFKKLHSGLNISWSFNSDENEGKNIVQLLNKRITVPTCNTIEAVAAYFGEDNND